MNLAWAGSCSPITALLILPPSIDTLCLSCNAKLPKLGLFMRLLKSLALEKLAVSETLAKSLTLEKLAVSDAMA